MESEFLLIIYKKCAIKFLKKQNKKIAKKIIEAINKIPNGDIKRLKGYDNLYRLRINSIRIIFTLKDNLIYIENIDNRGDIYKKGVI